MDNLRPNGQRARNAIMLIWIILALEITSFISAYFQYQLLQTIAGGGEISLSAVTTNDLREKIISIIYELANIVSIVTFIQWFRRAYFNLHQKVASLSYSEGMAVGCWFIPFINLYRPYQIMRELYAETKELLTKNGINYYGNFAIVYLGWWWACWIISNIFQNIIFQYSLKSESINELTNSTVASMVGYIIGIPLALITIKIIKDYSIQEPLLLEVNNEEATTQEITEPN